ncbi:MAG: histone deacetylase family protein [Hydrogenophaga sp.]|nr:histone deacetylase family protein [Hydrogenophaga sp.]
MQTAYYTHSSFLLHEMGGWHPESPARLRAIDDRLHAAHLFDFLAHHDAPAVTRAQLLRVHAAAYVDAIEAAAPRTGVHVIGVDASMNPHTLTAARHAAGGAVDAVDRVMRGEVANAFVACRPPGHHATRDQAMGFCFFNNVAVAAAHALAAHGLERVAIVDFDVHHGNGSEDIFRGDERVLMCSIFEKGLYPFNGETATGENMVNVGLPSRSGSDAFREAVTQHWIPALDAFAPELIYISAGFDAHREDDMGNLGLVEADYAWVTQELMKMAQKHGKGRVISCLEGGYVLSPLARSVAAHVRVLIGAD